MVFAFRFPNSCVGIPSGGAAASLRASAAGPDGWRGALYQHPPSRRLFTQAPYSGVLHDPACSVPSILLLALSPGIVAAQYFMLQSFLCICSDLPMVETLRGITAQPTKFENMSWLYLSNRRRPSIARLLGIGTENENASRLIQTSFQANSCVQGHTL